MKSGTLFGTACKLGAISSGVNEKAQEAFHAYGLKIGEAYQIADDLQAIKHHMSIGSIQPDRMALLAPALLYFVDGMRPHVLAIMRGKYTRLEKEALKYLDTAVHLMGEELERRLQSAVSELKKIPLKATFESLLRSAPGELINMFNDNS